MCVREYLIHLCVRFYAGMKVYKTSTRPIMFMLCSAPLGQFIASSIKTDFQAIFNVHERMSCASLCICRQSITQLLVNECVCLCEFLAPATLYLFLFDSRDFFRFLLLPSYVFFTL